MFFFSRKSNCISSLFLIRTISSSPILEINYYSILGLSPAATQGDIKKAYFELCKKHHPDKNKGSTDSNNKFRIIKEAYETLGNEKLRKVYDERVFQRYSPIGIQKSKMKQHENYSCGTEKFFYQNITVPRRYVGKTWYYDFDMWNECHYPNLKKKKSQRSWSSMESEYPTNVEKSKLYGVQKLLLSAMIFICCFVMIMPLFNPPNFNLHQISKKSIKKYD